MGSFAIAPPPGFVLEEDLKFNRAMDMTAGLEGGFTVDSGGPTNYGITQSTLDTYQQKNKLPKIDVRAIKPEYARKIAKEEYFVKPKFHLLPDDVSDVIFDYGFNSGTSKAAKDLQRTVGATPDGVIGPKTLKAVDNYIEKNGKKSLLKNILDKRQGFMKGLIKQDPEKYGPYEKGWDNRIKSFKDKFDLSALNPFHVEQAQAEEYPPLPEGFMLQENGMEDMPPLPKGFVLKTDEPPMFRNLPKKNPIERIADNIKTFFRRSPEESIAQAQNIYAISKQTGIPLEEVEKNIETLSRDSKITGIKPQNLTNDEYSALVFAPFIGAGVLSAPMTTAVTLGAFSALDKIVNLADFVPEDANDATKTTVELADFMLKGALIGGISRKTPKLIETLFQKKMEEVKLPRTLTLSKDQVRDIFQTGKLTTAEEQSLFAGLGLTGKEIKTTALKEGVEINVPGEKLIRLVDKPGWAKFKAVIKAKPMAEKFPHDPMLQSIAGSEKTFRTEIPGDLKKKDNIVRDAQGQPLRIGKQEVPSDTQGQRRVQGGEPQGQELGRPVQEQKAGQPSVSYNRVVQNGEIVPQFKSTEDALEYGKSIRGNPEAIASLEQETVRLKDEAAKLLEADKEEEYLHLVSGQKQFVKEALQEAKGEIKTGIARSKAEIERRLSDEDKSDIAKLVEFESNMPDGQRITFINDEGQREFIGQPSGHSAAMQEIGPKQTFALLNKAAAGEKLTDGEHSKVVSLLKDFRDNVKPRLESNLKEIENVKNELSESETREVIDSFKKEARDVEYDWDGNVVKRTPNAQELAEVKKQVEELNTENLEELIEKRYEVGASQQELDMLEDLYAERISEENIDMVEHEPDLRETLGQGADLEELLVYHYSEFLKPIKERVGSYSDKDLVLQIRAQIVDFAKKDLKNISDEEILDAAKDLYEWKRNLLEKQKSKTKKFLSKSKLTPSGQVRLELQPSAKTELFQEKGELFTGKKQLEPEEFDKKGDPKSGRPLASTGQFTETIKPKTAEFELKPIESIEMVKLAKELTDRYPQLKNFPKARGMFYGQGKGHIKLNPSLFVRGQEKQLAATLAHEIGHLIDYLPDRELRRGNMLGHLLTLRRFMKNVFQVDLETMEAGLEISNKRIMKEMKALSFEWRPLEGEADDYRNSSVEIFADFISALLNNPGWTKDKAPNGFKLFFDNLDKKPEVKKAYFELQELLNGKPEDVIKARGEDIRRMFAKGEEMRDQMDKEKKLARVNIYERIRQLLDDKYFPITDKLGKLEAKGVIPKSETIHELQKWGLADNDNYLMLSEIDEKVVLPILDHGMTTEDLGEYLFLKRVIGRTTFESTEAAKSFLKEKGGAEEFIDKLEENEIMSLLKEFSDREDIANPLGFAPEAAKKQLSALQKNIGPERFETLEKSAKQFHDIIFKSVEEAVNVGSYNTALFEKVLKPNKDYYVTFGVLNYLQDYVPSSIRMQKGTLSEIENPFLTTVLKTISLNRLNARQRAVNSFVESWKQLFPGDIAESKVRRVEGKPVAFIPQHGKGQIKYLVDGRPASVDVDPYIARSFDKPSPIVYESAAILNAMFQNKNFKHLVITYNLGFSLVFNPMRDFKRTYKNLNALGHKITVGQLLSEYWKNLPRTIQRQKGINDEQIKEMLASKALDTPFVDYNFDIREDSFARELRKFRLAGELPPPVGNVREKLLSGVIRVLEGVRFIGSVTENLSKVSGYNYLKEKNIDDAQRSWITRNYIGTPNYRTKGEISDVSNQIFIFSNIMKEGLKADLQLASNPKTRKAYWWAEFKVNLWPKVLMSAAVTGLAGKELKEYFDKVPEYDKTNYIIIPLGETKDKRAVYARIPHDETSRLFAAMMYKTLTMSENKDFFTDVFSFGAGQLPGVAPAITIADNWTQYLSGKNPYDKFRGRYVVPDKVFEAGGVPVLKKMAQWSFNQAGFSQFTTYDDRRDSTFEAVLKATPGLNAVTRVLKVSDYGLAEKMRELNKQEKKESAKLMVKRQELFDKYLKGYDINDLDRILDEGANIVSNDVNKKLSQITREVYGDYDKEDRKLVQKDFLKYIIREQNNPYMEALTSATSNDAKLMILEEAHSSMSYAEYRSFLEKAYKAKIISKNVRRDASQAMQSQEASQ